MYPYVSNNSALREQRSSLFRELPLSATMFEKSISRVHYLWLAHHATVLHVLTGCHQIIHTASRTLPLQNNAPQDIKEDKEVAKASIEVQRAWRGWASRKRTRWVRMEREGRRRLSRMRKDIEDERAFEEEERSRTKRWVWQAFAMKLSRGKLNICVSGRFKGTCGRSRGHYDINHVSSLESRL